MNTRAIIGGIIILFGLSSLLGFPIFRIIIPLFIIWLGWRILYGGDWSSRWNKNAATEHAHDIDEILIFSGTKRVFKSSDFKGGRIVVIFAGADIDLTDVKTKQKDIRMELVAVFGGIKLKVPDSWHISSDAVSILGGINNKTQPKKEIATKMHFTGAAVFGGIELFN